MVTGLAWVVLTVPVTLAILGRTAPCPTHPTLTSSRRTLKVDVWLFDPAQHLLTFFHCHILGPRTIIFPIYME